MTVHKPAGHSTATLAAGPLIGVCWQPGQRVPTPILGGPDQPVVDGRYGIPARFGDDMASRSPTHYERHTLHMRPGKAAVELRRANGQREVYAARLVGVIPSGSTMQVTRPDGSTVLLGEDAFCVIGRGAYSSHTTRQAAQKAIDTMPAHDHGATIVKINQNEWNR